MLVFKTMPSPLGKLKLVGSDQGLAAVLWENDPPGRVRLNISGENQTHPVLLETERQLNAYFAGKLQTFTVPLHMTGTPFQQKVWNALIRIPFGTTLSYSQLATQLGHPNAARAVGAANGKNPFSIISPCHRLIGASGHLTDFAGGLAAKQFLLDLEKQS